MTPETTKPSVITAAQFVAYGYAAKIAAGECVVYDHTNDIVVDVNPIANTYTWKHKSIGKLLTLNIRGNFYVKWLKPATPATNELASLRAQVARYRSALEAVASEVNELEYVTENNSSVILWGTVKSSIRGIRAALAETEEA